jgi:8-oxo-dGTP pyrophosphatase MutT (NUDIX family)
MKYSVCAVILNADGLVLGVSRKDNQYDMGLPGGKVDPEDEYFDERQFKSALHQACWREVKEETGLDVDMSTSEMVFAMHKDGYMGYTFYIKDWSGEINYDEPHVVGWKPFEVLINGSFGLYNRMVKESLIDMGISVVIKIPIEPLIDELNEYLTEIEFPKPITSVSPSTFGSSSLELHLERESSIVCVLKEANKEELSRICQKHGFKDGRFPYYYYPK